MPKRTVGVSIKISEEDLALFQKAASQIWPEAILTRTSIILGLARIGAKCVLSKHRHK
jgi:hypothetical protein